MKYSVCIIGGGAAGLAAAASFNKELNICILEKNPEPGRKLGATGGGRCNLTNAACENTKLTLNFFRKLGIETRCDNEGRYYPYTNRASDVTKALLDSLGDNVTIKCNFNVKVISRVKAEIDDINGFMITGGDEIIFADKVIIAMGGKAGPQFGTTGAGYSIARSLGHRVTRVYPALTGIQCAGAEFPKLKGIRSRGRVTLFKDELVIASELGEIQFTEDGISGICVFNLTGHITAEEGEKPQDAMRRYSISLDLAPDFSQEEISGRSSSFGIVTSKLADFVSVEKLKDWRFQITGVKGWKEAQVTAGGVVLDDINMETMESEVVPGLYFAGEIIDVQGPCGGFNLQNAWETGIKAAKAAEASFDRSEK